nr:MAG TPA: hypothetical protein [Caudoviricetes sp.]
MVFALPSGLREGGLCPFLRSFKGSQSHNFVVK